MPAYVPTNWVDGLTPVNAANLNKIEAELVDTDTTIGNYLPIDSVVAAATRVQANKLVAGDAQPAFRFLGDGKLQWGPGGSTAPDTTLYRSAVGMLKTDGNLTAGQFVSTGPGTTGGMLLGGDTTLYRANPNILKTDGEFQAKGNVISYLNITSQIMLGDGTSNATIIFGSAQDTKLYRSAAGVLKTDGQLSVKTSGSFTPGLLVDGGSGTHAIHVRKTAGDAQPALLVDNTGGLFWGPGGSTGTDAFLNRSGANALRTGGALAVDGVLTCAAGFSCNPPARGPWPLVYQVQGESQRRFQITDFGDLGWGPGGSTSPDTTLSRAIVSGSPTLLTPQFIQTRGLVGHDGINGSVYSNAFNLQWSGSVANLWVDNVNLGVIASGSDARFKHMVEPLASTWETVKQLAPVSYRWRDEGILMDDGKDHVGFIAQDVQKTIPSGASGGTDGKADSEQPMTLNLPDIVATMCKALQEAMARIEALEAA